MHIHYLLTGDDRALDAGRAMARFCLTRWDPRYRPDRYVEPPLGVDPEKDRAFWSTRHEAYGLLGVLHGWEMTGDEVYWRRILEYLDALAAHQASRLTGGHPTDPGARTGRSTTRTKRGSPGGASPWMTAILLSALFHAWRVTGDARIPGMVSRWCDFLDRRIRRRRIARALRDRLFRRQPSRRSAGSAGAGHGAAQHGARVQLRDGTFLLDATPTQRAAFPKAVRSALRHCADDRREQAGALLQLGVPGVEPARLLHERR